MLSNSLPKCPKSPNQLILEAKDIFAINMELGAQLEQAYIHVSEHILTNLRNMMGSFNEHNSSNWSDSIKLLMLTRDMYYSIADFGGSPVSAHIIAGQYFIQKSTNPINEVESKQKQVEPSHESLKRQESLLICYDNQSSKRQKLSHEDEDKKKNSIDYSGGMNGQNFFWYQHESDEDYEIYKNNDLYEIDSSIYSDSQSENDINSSDISSYSQELPNPDVSRIITNEEHISLLKSVIRDADNYVLIASYGISIDILNQLQDDIVKIRSMGVGLHFYNSDKKPCSPEVMKFINENKICYEQIQTHSKFLISDGRVAAIGSFNWLSSDYLKFPNSQNGTLVISGDEICSVISSQIRVYIRQYIDKKVGTIEAISSSSFRELGTTNVPIYFDLKDGEKLIYLATLDAHRSYINSAFKIAKSSLTICCPFINSSSGFLKDLPPNLLSRTANRGVKINLVCNSSDAYKLHNAYGKLLKAHRNIEVMTTEHLHQKTLIVDEHLIADGSFNWMSASRDEKSRYHNCEITMIYEGPKAKLLIDAFNKNLQEKIKSSGPTKAAKC